MNKKYYLRVIDEYSHEIAPLVANSAPLILTDEHHLIA